MSAGKFDPKRDDDLFVSLDGESRLGQVDFAQPANLIADTPSDYETDSEPGLAWNYLGLAVSSRRVAALFMGIAACLSLVTVRVAHMQVIEGDYYSDRATGNRLRVEWLPSERGIIYDRHGEALVRNEPRFNLTITPSDLPTDARARQAIILRLADILELPPLEIEGKIGDVTGVGQQAVVAEGLTHEQAVLAAVASADIGAVQLSVGTRRHYIYNEETPSLSHVLGYLGRVTEAEVADQPERSLPTDLIGKVGLEKRYEQLLRGQYGESRYEIDVRGKRKKTITEEAGSNGQSLQLTLDLAAQQAAEAFLQDSLDLYGKARGSVVVLDPQTGDVLALVSLPAYDANAFSRGLSTEEYQALISDPERPLFPRAIAGLLPSGSTFKLVVAAAALDQGLISRWTTIMSTGGISVSRWVFPDWKGGGHGLTDVTKAIAESVNTFFYAIGGGWDKISGLGAATITDYAARFGLGSPTGIDLDGEAAGFLPSKAWKESVKGERWYIGDTYHLAIGQGDLLVTPLQIAAMTAAFANEGKLIQPGLVSGLVNTNGQITAIERPVTPITPFKPEAIALVRQGMREAVTVGSARSMAALPVEAAAKTGTAQWGRGKDPHAWLTAFAPYDNPEVVVTVVVEEGEGGSISATPVARRFLDWWYSGRPPLEEYREKPWYWTPPVAPEPEPTTEVAGTEPVEPLDPDTRGIAAP
jgi:penicillin-binding protein 2